MFIVNEEACYAKAKDGQILILKKFNLLQNIKSIDIFLEI
ncbi:17358_t:CDS:2 [Gigaspora margarita]|uniref:17358_t:CDS:1 n=1 Tax=Gigaspora margarita TaxID=4874 RepID=A0ABN7U9A0_GIGMA|nr:17358_t:CDS:2 [Gigaspora margarita]